MIIRYPGEKIVVSRQEFIFLFLVVIFLGSATVLTQGSLEGLIFAHGGGFLSLLCKGGMFVFSVIILQKCKVPFERCFDKKAVIVLLVWTVLQVIKYHSVSPFPVMRLMNLYFASMLVFCYGKRILYVFDRILVILAAISLLFWLLDVLIPDIVRILLNLSPIKGVGLMEGNTWIVYASGSQFELVKRNIGFAWEPGRFGSILAFGAFVNLIVHRFKIYNIGFIILSLAVCSTQSTTSLGVYMVVLFFALYNTRRKYFYLLAPIVISFVIVVMGLDFMGEKLNGLSIFNEDHITGWEKQLEYYETQDGFLVPQRFDGLLLEAMNILHDPIIGNATDQYSYLYSIFGINFSLSNGCLRIFATMGVVMGVLYYILCVRASKWMSETYRYKGKMAFFMIFILINISYSWVFEPFFLSIVLYPYLMTRSVKKKRCKYETKITVSHNSVL